MPDESLPLPAMDLAAALDQDPSLWGELRGLRILITGGTGFVGAWMVELLLAAQDRWRLGVHLTLLTRDPQATARRYPHVVRRADVAVVGGDVRSFVAPPAPHAIVVHGAASTALATSAAELDGIAATIVDGTRRAVDVARRSGARRFLYLSSGSADAGRRLPTRSRYGEAKLDAESYVLEHAAAGRARIDAVIARGFSFLGGRLPLDDRVAAGTFLRQGLAGGPIRLVGSGMSRRSYLYGADMAWWMWAVLLKGRPGATYDVGSDEPVTIQDLARATATLMGVPLMDDATAAPGAGIFDYLPDIRPARDDLGLKRITPWRVALEKTIEWLRSAAKPSRA